MKDILVHVDTRATCAGRLDLAVRLAAARGAQLTGIYVTDFPFFSPRPATPEKVRKKARKLFEEAADRGGVEAEWIEVDSKATGLGTVEAVNIHAHYHDLVVLSQTDVSSGDRSVPSDLPDRAVLGAGRPVLLVPYAGIFDTVGQRVLLAWRGGPESSRALNDALPLLQGAKKVHILSVRQPGEEEVGPGLDLLLRHLERHGIRAEAERAQPTGHTIGDLLLNRSAELGIDLLVMGAFSQSRRGLWGLGDVGRHLMKYMTVPVLMSH